MPVIKSAKKKLRKDKKLEIHNKSIRNLLRSLIKKAKLEKTSTAVIAAVKTADKAAKNHIIHKNKAARIKSTLYILLTTPKESKPKKSSVRSKKTLLAAA